LYSEHELKSEDYESLCLDLGLDWCLELGLLKGFKDTFLDDAGVFLG